MTRKQRSTAVTPTRVVALTKKQRSTALTLARVVALTNKQRPTAVTPARVVALTKKQRPTAVTLALVVALFFFAETARADDPAHARAALDYAMPKDLDACADRDAFVSSVATRLGYDPFAGEDAPPKTLIVSYRKDGARAVAYLRLAQSKKNIASQTASCSELGSGAAFAAA